MHLSNLISSYSFDDKSKVDVSNEDHADPPASTEETDDNNKMAPTPQGDGTDKDTKATTAEVVVSITCMSPSNIQSYNPLFPVEWISMFVLMYHTFVSFVSIRKK